MVTTAAGQRLPDGDLTQRVIGAYFAVFNGLRPGLLEAVYKRAMAAELAHLGLAVATEVPYSVTYRGQLVGEYRADLVVEQRLIVECKCADKLAAVHEAQLLNYLCLANLEIGLLLNFGPAAMIRRLARSSPRGFIPGDPRVSP